MLLMTWTSVLIFMQETHLEEEMEKIGDTELKFPCSSRYDQLVRSVLPYARNVSGTEDMLESDDSRGQMTTGTLGFSQ